MASMVHLQLGIIIEELKRCLLLFPGKMCIINVLCNLPKKQRSSCFIPVMALISHLQRLCNHYFHINLTMQFQRFFDDRIIFLFHPVQTVKYFLVACTETQHLSQSLIHSAVSMGIICFIYNMPDRHMVGNDSGHRAYGIMVMTWGKCDFPAGRQFLCLF